MANEEKIKEEEKRKLAAKKAEQDSVRKPDQEPAENWEKSGVPFWQIALISRQNTEAASATPAPDKTKPVSTNGDAPASTHEAGHIAPDFNIRSGFTASKVPALAGISAGFQAATNEWMGTRYQMGGDGKNGIDCSRFVRRASEAAFSNLPASVQKQLNTAMASTSEGQYVNLEKISKAYGIDVKPPVSGDKTAFKNSLQGGEVIFLDTGVRGHDRGRANGIDHVVVTFKIPGDPEIYVAESRGSVGVGQPRTLDQWFASSSAKNATLRVMDLNEIASTMSAQPDPSLSARNISSPGMKVG